MSSLESLPDELLLMIWNYLSLYDLCQSFIHIENVRFKSLLQCQSHSLIINSLRYDQICQLFEDKNQFFTKSLINLVNTFILDGSISCRIFLQKFIENSSLLNSFSNLKTLIVFDGCFYGYNSFVRSILSPLTNINSILQKFSIKFTHLNSSYTYFLSQLVSDRISIEIILLEITEGYDFPPTDQMNNIYDDLKGISWIYTKRLRLSIEHTSELFHLFQSNSLPVLEYLYVTIEQMDFTLSESCLQQLDKYNYSINQIGPRKLQTLIIRYIHLKDLIILINCFTMKSLENLTLIDIYDQTLDHIDQFDQICSTLKIRGLKNLYFSFRFPESIKKIWQENSFVNRNQWPLNNLRYLKETCLMKIMNRFGYIQQTFFIVYKSPINILLEYTRIIHNHSFTNHLDYPMIRNQSFHLIWTSNQIDQSNKFIKTLQTIAGKRITTIDIKYFQPLQENVEMIESKSSLNDLSFVYLRSINFHFLQSSFKRSERVSIMTKILNHSPNVIHLTVIWVDFDCCSRILNNLKHIQLILDHSSYQDRDPFDINRLFQLTPNLNHLQTSIANLFPDEKLIQFISRIINRFHRLINLTINKNSLYSSKYEKKIRFKQLFMDACDNRHYQSKKIHINFRINDEISICL